MKKLVKCTYCQGYGKIGCFNRAESWKETCELCNGSGKTTEIKANRYKYHYIITK